jgi:hypothetical protein
MGPPECIRPAAFPWRRANRYRSLRLPAVRDRATHVHRIGFRVAGSNDRAGHDREIFQFRARTGPHGVAAASGNVTPGERPADGRQTKIDKVPGSNVEPGKPQLVDFRWSEPRNPMDKELHRNRNPVRAIAAVMFLMAVTIVALLVAVERNGSRIASNDQPAAGASGMARPHPPLDRAPGEALKVPL